MFLDCLHLLRYPLDRSCIQRYSAPPPHQSAFSFTFTPSNPSSHRTRLSVLPFLQLSGQVAYPLPKSLSLPQPPSYGLSPLRVFSHPLNIIPQISDDWKGRAFHCWPKFLFCDAIQLPPTVEGSIKFLRCFSQLLLQPVS